MTKKTYQYEKRISHIPFDWKFIGLFFIFLGSIFLAIKNFFLLISVGNTYKVWELLSSDLSKESFSLFSQLIILYPLIGEYLLIFFCFISLTALIKGGFNKVKSYEKEGLIYEMISGLILGLILGLIFGLIIWLIIGPIFGLISGLIIGLIFGPIFGLISGLIIGLIFGLISGLIDEFK